MPLAIGFGLSTLLGIFLGVIGPFGSYLNGGLAVRLIYWTSTLWAGSLLFGLVLPLLARLAGRRGWPLWGWAPAAVAVLSAPMAALSRLLALSIWPRVGDVGVLEWYGQCLAISALASGLILWRVLPRAGEKPAPHAADPRDRLPFELGREVLCLQMEDHYVRVHTPRGSALVLMSLGQAMAGLQDLEGAQTHRSWWVARKAVEGWLEDGRNLRLRLTGGLEAPVSRARIARLRDEGWLPQ
ncbi:MAG: LytTR family transcriptional regulator [Caulobacteraceae bacterium]|nr:MAG: LytTR family transcriptional regulator [Caulobacteraceae bacterium]